MTVTREQVLKGGTFHAGQCTITIGPRGGVTSKCETWRANGSPQTWVTRPDDFRLPLKYGMYDYGQLTPQNAYLFHTSNDCAEHVKIVDNRPTAQQHVCPVCGQHFTDILRPFTEAFAECHKHIAERHHPW